MSRSLKKIIFFLILNNTCFSLVVSSQINWKSITCENVDEIVAVYKKCYIKPLRRNVAALNVDINIKRRPLNNFWVNINFQKRANGWKPFLYNISFSACKFLGSKKKNPIPDFFYRFTGLATHSNLNHSCPYNHDISIINHTFVDTIAVSETLPLPSGDYGIFTTWTVDGMPRLQINAYFVIKD